MMNVQLKLWLSLVATVALGAGVFDDAARAAVKPQKIFASASVNFRSANGKTPKNSINFFDVATLPTGVGTDTFIDKGPLFSVFIGFDSLTGFSGLGAPTGNEEDAGVLTVNPVNGTMYTVAFNQLSDPLGGLTPVYGESRATDDTAGDFDLFKIDYQAILKDFTTNNRARGTIYAPEFAVTSTTFEATLVGGPNDDGVVDGKVFGLNHEESFHFDALDVNDPITVRLPGAITKIGETGRAPTDRTGSAAFFNVQMEFIDPETFLRLDGTNNNTPAGDNQIRLMKRVSKLPEQAVADVDGPDNLLPADFNAATDNPGSGADVNGLDDNQGGFNRGTTESWESYIIGRLQMDGADRSDNPEWAAVKKNGVLGVWVAEEDRTGIGPGVGDDLSFYEINLSGPTPTVTKKDLFKSGAPPVPNFIDLAENPSVDPNTADGELDNLLVDAAGNLIVIESGFNDTTAGDTTPPTGAGSPGLRAQEPHTYSVGIGNYAGPDTDGDGVGEVLPTGAGVGFNDPAPWTASRLVTVPPATDDDTGVTDTRFVAYDRGTGYIYIIESESSATTAAADLAEDLYVFDPATGTIVYSEKNAFDPAIINKGTQIIFVRGDVNEDGVVNATDIDAFTAGMRDNTIGGLVTAAVGQEWYDLTGDGLLNTADLDEFIHGILGTEYGDHDLDGDVDSADLSAWTGGFGTGTGWANGDNNGDDKVDGADFLRWQQFVGFDNALAVAAADVVPEPSAAVLFAVAALALIGRRRAR